MVRITALLTFLLGLSMGLGLLPRSTIGVVHALCGLATVALAFLALRGVTGPPLAWVVPWLFVLPLLLTFVMEGNSALRLAHPALGLLAIILLEVALARRHRAAHSIREETDQRAHYEGNHGASTRRSQEE